MFNLSLSPSQIEFVLKPGITLTQAYNITNNSDQTIRLNTEVLPFLPQGDNGSVSYSNVLTNPNISFSLMNADLKLGQPFNLKPNETRQLVLKIKTSPQTELADFYSTFFVYQSIDSSAYNTNFSQSTGKIGSHVLLSISHEESPKISAQVLKFWVTPKIKDVFFTPLNFSAQINNQTNYFFKSNGKITVIKNKKIVKELTLESQNVLANYFRRLLCQKQETCTLSPPLWPGHYIATLEFDSNLNIPSVSTSFFVLPISPILFLLLIFSLIFLSKWFRKRFNKTII